MRLDLMSFSKASFRARVVGIESAEKYPPHPQPLSRVGAREADFNTETKQVATFSGET